MLQKDSIGIVDPRKCAELLYYSENRQPSTTFGLCKQPQSPASRGSSILAEMNMNTIEITASSSALSQAIYIRGKRDATVGNVVQCLSTHDDLLPPNLRTEKSRLFSRLATAVKIFQA